MCIPFPVPPRDILHDLVAIQHDCGVCCFHNKINVPLICFSVRTKQLVLS